MRLYYPDLCTIEQQTRQLEHQSCRHCGQIQQLVSHGFIYQKRAGADPQAVGKRVFCSNRQRRTGCGRTMRLYLQSAVRYLHYAGAHVVAFVLALIAGCTVQHAYAQATGTPDARHAYRWLHRLHAQLSAWRSLAHRPPWPAPEAPATVLPLAPHPARRRLLASTFQALLQHFGQPLCARYQRHTQRPLL